MQMGFRSTFNLDMKLEPMEQLDFAGFDLLVVSSLEMGLEAGVADAARF